MDVSPPALPPLPRNEQEWEVLGPQKQKRPTFEYDHKRNQKHPFWRRIKNNLTLYKHQRDYLLQQILLLYHYGTMLVDWTELCTSIFPNTVSEGLPTSEPVASNTTALGFALTRPQNTKGDRSIISKKNIHGSVSDIWRKAWPRKVHWATEWGPLCRN